MAVQYQQYLDGAWYDVALLVSTGTSSSGGEWDGGSADSVYIAAEVVEGGEA